jgi:hypothetical protein
MAHASSYPQTNPQPTTNHQTNDQQLTWLWKDSPYVIAARKLFNMAVASNDAGDPFPIWGTCLGHQLLQILATNISRNDLLVETDSVAHPATLELTDAAKESRMFGGMPSDLIEKIGSADYNIALENHMYGVPPAFYERWPDLAEWYNVLSTTKDRNGLEYISSIEGVKYPFFGEKRRRRERASLVFSRLVVAFCLTLLTTKTKQPTHQNNQKTNRHPVAPGEAPLRVHHGRDPPHHRRRARVAAPR